MPSSLLPRQPHDPNGDSTSIFLPTVCLYDWWLIQADEGVQGKSLGVAGFTSPKDGYVKRAIRVFKSAPITKAYDFSTLETADNVCVILKGLMNKSLTTENGFSHEVCKHFVFGFPVNWGKFVTKQGNSSACKTPKGQGIPDKKDQKSPGEHRNFKKENQPCDKTKNNSTESATDYLDPDLRQAAKKETPEEVPSSAPVLVKTKRAPNHDVGQSIPVEKSRTSPRKHKSDECTNQLNVRARNNSAAESAHNRLGSNHLRDYMKENRKDPSAACSLKSNSSSRDHIDEGSPGKKDQTYPCKQNSVKNANRSSVRMRSYHTAESAKNHLGSDHPRNDMEETEEEPSSEPALDQGTPRKHRNAKNRKGYSTITRGKGAIKSAQERTSANHPKDGLEETQAEPSSASPVVKPRRSLQHQMGAGKEDAAQRETTAGVIPNTQGMIRTPDSFKRSRSGRILLPKLAYWLNELPIYDENRSIAGVQGPTTVVDFRDNGNVSSRK